MAANLGTISKGRFVLRYGAGWYQPEYEAYGYVFPGPGTRVSMPKEGLKVVNGLLREERFSFSGRLYHVKDAINELKPPSRIPVMVGGGGERIIGLAVEYGDAWDVGPGLKPDLYERKVEVLKREPGGWSDSRIRSSRACISGC